MIVIDHLRMGGYYTHSTTTQLSSFALRQLWIGCNVGRISLSGRSSFRAGPPILYQDQRGQFLRVLLSLPQFGSLMHF